MRSSLDHASTNDSLLAGGRQNNMRRGPFAVKGSSRLDRADASRNPGMGGAGKQASRNENSSGDRAIAELAPHPARSFQ